MKPSPSPAMVEAASAMDSSSSRGGGNENVEFDQSVDGVQEAGDDENDRHQEKGNSKAGDGFPIPDRGGRFDCRDLAIVRPHSGLPRPEPPQGVGGGAMEREVSSPETFETAIGNFIRTKSNSVSEAISRMARDGDGDGVEEFNLVGMKVIKTLKDETKELKGRIAFFSRSNCRDCGAMRSFFRERNLNFVEINVDVYPEREKELFQRTGGGSVPQLFFNEKLIGGLVAMNSLRNSGMLEAKMEEILTEKCPPDAPAPPVYGFDEADKTASDDEMAALVRVARQRVPLQDRLMKMKFVNNCFSGADLVEVLIHHLDCGRRKAVDIGKRMARKHFIHHVFGENEFEDGRHYYRFLEHEPFIAKCHNFRMVNDFEPKSAIALSQRLFHLMAAIIESYALNDNRRHLDFVGISKSEEFRRYLDLVEDLQRVDLMTLSQKEKLVFFLNLHNAMAIHAVTRIGSPSTTIDRRMAFFSEFMYVLNGYSFSLSNITNGILRGNRRPPYFPVKPFSRGDKRLELAFEKVNPLIHFGIWNASNGSPSIRFFSTEGVDYELRTAAREYLQGDCGVKVDLTKRTVYLPMIIKWYSSDFGQEKEILKWIMNFLDPTQTGLLTHLLSDGCSVNIAYHTHDWSLNS